MHTGTDAHLAAVYRPSALPAGFLPYPLPAFTPLPSTPQAPSEEVTTAFASTELDPDEIPQQPHRHRLEPPAAPSESLTSSFRHSGWKDVRRRVYDAMKALKLSSSRLERFAKCGHHAWVEATYSIDAIAATCPNTAPSRHRVRCNTCRDRFCIPCQGTRARIVARSLIALLEGQPARFITFTLKHSDTPLSDQLDRLYRSYARLRKTVLWQRHCYAGAAMLEIKRSANDGCWHPHLHVLAKGKYIPHAKLKEEWHRITKDSFVVDIRFIHDPAKAASYVSKYVTKPMVATYSTDTDALTEAIEAMHHRRTVLLTGEWKSLKVEKPTDDALWTYVGTLETVLLRALAGEPEAVQLMDGLRSNQRWRPTETARSP